MEYSEVDSGMAVVGLPIEDNGEYEFEFAVNGEATKLIQAVEHELRLNDIVSESFKVEVEPPASMIQYDVEVNAVRASIVFRYPKFYMHVLMDILQDVSRRLELKSTLRPVEGMTVRR